MNESHVTKIAQELNIMPGQVMATAKLFEDGATVPFIARYRKEVTASLDEVAITAIRDRKAQLEDLDRRRESILNSLEERALLTDDLKEKLLAADNMASLENIYLPYKPKRRTRATIAKEKGLEPLAKTLFEQNSNTNPIAEANAFINPDKGVETAEEALAGSRDIVAEWVNENQEAREKMTAHYADKGVFQAKVLPDKEVEGAKFRDYFDWKEPVARAPSHRILAMRRAEKEGFISLRISPPEEKALALLESLFVAGKTAASEEVTAAVRDSYDRLLGPAIETQIRTETKIKSDTEAIKVFADNLRELLLAPPLGQKNVMAVDPGIRTGCKIACLDRQGKLLETTTVYPLKSEKAQLAAATSVKALFDMYEVETIAVGNGTGGRETVSFIESLNLPRGAPVVMVNESGASVYSASQVARDEFPDLDLSFRGAVSIGRRLMDPLAELVKIDPKSIGVGQYQHDVNQQALKRGLDDVVISCVNAVGVEINTASEQLLTYVSGLGPQLAKNIVAHRNDNGPLSSRQELKKIPRLGPKAFEQAAGFLRIKNGTNPLDASAVHPESYHIVRAMAADLGSAVKDLIQDDKLSNRIDIRRYLTDQVGMPTLTDIMVELAKPGRDPREEFEALSFSETVKELKDIKPGMKLPGVVTNVTAFGAFVDVGVHQDGLVHISQMADAFVKNPHKVVKVNQRVTVTVLEVDLERRRISLSLRRNPHEAGLPIKRPQKQDKKKQNEHRPDRGQTSSPNN
ncbi:MAG: RNA-binding transcriptional accessory protein, partial [Deltaproteobacteria bacterium]|nr:RNA-binding transcriptional accessory protein [Deltaproteobacteria bacterium]